MIEFLSLLMIPLGLSFPVFYVLGIVYLFQLHHRRRNQIFDRKSQLEFMISDLQARVQANPNVTLAEQLDLYRAELSGYTTSLVSVPAPAPQTSTESVAQTVQPQTVESNVPAGIREENISHDGAPNSVSAPVQVAAQATASTAPSSAAQSQSSQNQGQGSWQHWYSDNSINLLLYIGAFLIVASATVYVGFQWQQIDGSLKAALLSILTAAFFGLGYWLYLQPKIRQAGVTFLGIGSLLIPFNGLAWYNFSLGPNGVSSGIAWAVTSIVALVIYVWLAVLIKSRFYSYIVSLSSLSFLMAIVNITEVSRQYYILAGMATALALLIVSYAIRSRRKDQSDEAAFITPFFLSASVIMPISLTWSFGVALVNNAFFSWIIVIAVLLATLYYLVSYSFARQTSYFQAGAYLFALAVFVGLITAGLTTAPAASIIILLAVGYIMVMQAIRTTHAIESAALRPAALVLAAISLVIGILATLIQAETLSLQLASILLFGTIFYALYYWFTKTQAALASALIGGAMAVYTLLYTFDVKPLELFILMQVIALGYLGTRFALRNADLSLIQGLKNGSHILTIATLVSSLFYSVTLSQTTLQLIIVLLLGTLTWAIEYWKDNSNAAHVLTTLMLILLGLLIPSWLQLTTPQYYVVLEIALVLIFSLSLAAKSLGRAPVLASTVIALIAAGIVGLIAFGETETVLSLPLAAVLIVMPAVYAFVGYRLHGQVGYFYVVTAFADLAIAHIFGAYDHYDYASYAFFITGLLVYLAAVTKNLPYARTLFIISFINVLLSVIYIDNTTNAVITLAASGLLLTDYSIRIQRSLLVYLASGLFYGAFVSLLNVLKIDLVYYPVALSVFTAMLYLSHVLLPEFLKLHYRNIAIIAGLLLSIIFMNDLSDTDTMAKFSLTGAYIFTILFAAEAYLYKRNGFGYFATAFALLTVLRQIHFLGVTEAQAYVIPIGLYFLGVAYCEKRKGRLGNQTIFDILGIIFLLLPLTYQALFTDPTYALLLGLEGILLFIYGNTLKQRLHTVMGIVALVVAVLSQTHQYLLSLPRWLITALVGLIFLGAAIYLLLKRNDSHK